ncbi:MAG: hypothetical protein ACT4O2_12755 [Beijerinckiaceae bacterium]
MLFSIDEDTGSRIVGWVMPDNPATTPKIIIHLDPEHHVAIDAFVVRPLLREQGLHNTGVCGFVVNENNCPGVTAAGHLEIRDAENHILIYRRRDDSHLVDEKFLLLETQLFRSQSLDDALIARFHMSYKSLELLPEETTRSIFAISFTNSLFASGRIFWRVWEPMVRDRNFKAGIVLRDPFEELSERLLILKWASLAGANSAAAVLGQTVQLCAKAFCNVDLNDLSALRELLSHPSDELRAVLYNPFVYQLAAPNAFDPPRPPETAAALDSLAEMDAVGLRDDAGAFLRLVAAVLDLPDQLPNASPRPSETVIGLADKLRDMGPARALIEKDLEVYSEVARVLAPRPADQLA